MKFITVTVAPNGGVKIETTGFAGSACKDATRELEKALGTVTSDTPTAEARATTTTPDRAKLGQK